MADNAGVNWLQRIPSSTRSASGLEWVLWRRLPLITLVGTALPLSLLVVLHLGSGGSEDAAHLRWLQIADYVAWGVVVFHWTMVLTVAVGCVVVMVMKGPGYVADAYAVSHSDRPRNEPEAEKSAHPERPSS